VDRALAFSFWKFVKKVPAAAGAFFVLFGAFLRGVWEKCDFSDGVFVVKLWWICGELWSVDDRSVVG
jgi:hypothetical protein